jgi:hypothetical protein
MRSINDKDISIVLQGPWVQYEHGNTCVPDTQYIINTWRKLLPSAEIILSTWHYDHFDPLNTDHIIHNNDPGPLDTRDIIEPNAPPNNVNRQIISTLSGLRYATRKYAIKTRTDILVDSVKFIDYYFEDKVSDEKYKLLNRRLIIPNFYCIDPSRSGMCFHYSDLFHFGETIDLLKIWDIDLIDIRKYSHYPNYCFNFYGGIVSLRDRMLRPEQYIMVNFLRKYDRSIELDHANDLNWDKISKSEKYLVNNFNIYDYRKLGIKLPDRMLSGSHCIYKKIRLKNIKIRLMYTDFAYYYSRLSFNKIKTFICVNNFHKNVEWPIAMVIIIGAVRRPSLIFSSKRRKKFLTYQKNIRLGLKYYKMMSRIP